MDELNIENRIEIDRSEAEKYEFINESCVFSLLFFQPNNYSYTVVFFNFSLNEVKSTSQVPNSTTNSEIKTKWTLFRYNCTIIK